MKLTLALCVAITVQLISSDEFVCINGIPYKEDFCNTCFCRNNQLTCTEKYCGPVVKNCTCAPQPVDNCNMCRCVQDGGVICTNFYCPTPSTV